MYAEPQSLGAIEAKALLHALGMPIVRLFQDFRFFTSAVTKGTMSNKFPTTP
jgi:hypothetical protein